MYSTADRRTYYRVSICVPLSDYVLSQVESRFESHTKKVMQLNRLVPELPDVGRDEGFFQKALQLYRALLPTHSTQSASGELRCWRSMWAEKQISDRPRTRLKALQQCSRTCFPLIWRLLRIAVRQPVTTASVERSFSTLKRVKTWLRSTIGEDRLSALVMMACGPDAVPEPQAILERFLLLKNVAYSERYVGMSM